MKKLVIIFVIIFFVEASAQDLTQNYRKIILNSPNNVSLFQSTSSNGIWASGMINGDRWGVFEDATGSKERVSILSGGKVGVNTIAPESLLHINQINRHSGLMITEEGNSQSVRLHLAKFDDGREYGYFKLGDSTMLRGNGERSYFKGSLGIGTINPGNWKLAVNGKIRAKEIKVETSWSDFVFEKDYNLPTLEEVEQHIKENGHLKDIPSAIEVEENGIYLGDMNAKLLQKIEELMLYTIEQQKRINKYEETLKQLKEIVVKQQKVIKKLEVNHD
ncbi:hypothetical protein OOZ15_05395 [Galbibacter sp. EGI 63066]|uniref:hypothetical protein n=1 Tax=Galbibacter sp. EGI 63066 TaxID=2993559 RepID=UPI00224942CD|nr:hypothetical protein [Galbibacter sp. EGI 63066]MCX2679371.1 hypothetical protein [Galbibacter sp. EGI 63066]